MVAYRVVNLSAGSFPTPPVSQVTVPVLPSPPVHSLTEQTGSGLPVLPLVVAGLMVVGAIFFH